MHKDIVDFVLVDFGSTDGLKDWIVSNFERELEEGYLRYFYTDKLDSWHASVAKNTAHLLARGEILVNLDCDNFTGVRGAAHVINHFLKNADDIVLHQARDLFNGSFGRISVRRADFIAIGGYDESLLPMGYEDVDLIERLKALGLVYVHDSCKRFNDAIPNTREEGLANIKGRVNYAEMVQKNRLKSQDNIAEGHLVANRNHFWGIQILEK